MSIRAGGLLVLVAVAALLGGAASASADSVSVAVQTATPEQSVPVQFRFTGQAGAGGGVDVLYTVVRPAGGLGCQSTFQLDRTATQAGDVIMDGNIESGYFSDSASDDPPNPGSYLVCAWLETNNGYQLVYPVQTTTFTARPPQVPQLAVAPATHPLPGVAYQLHYTVQTDQQLRLYSVVKPAGGLPCAASYDLERQQNDSENVVIDGDSVFGGPSPDTGTDTESKGGPYLVCTWVQGPNDGEVDATLSTPIYVGTPPSPPPPPACTVPRIHAGWSVARVKRALAHNHCRAGRLRRAYSRVRRGEAVGLVAVAGRRYATGTPIAIVVSAGRRPRHHR